MRIKKDELAEMIGFIPGKEMRIQILKEVREGKTIQEAASKWNLGVMAILDSDLKFDYKGKRITVQEWKDTNPLGEFGKIIVIGTRVTMDKYRKTKSNNENIS
jgi:hypothetical protein